MAPEPPKPACIICLDLSKDLAQRSQCCLGLLFKTAKTCKTCNLLVQAIRHCFPEVAAAPESFKFYFSIFDGEMYQQQPDPVMGLSVARKIIPDGEEDPLEKIGGIAWKPRVVHIFSVKGMPCPWPLFTNAAVIPMDRQVLAKQARHWIDTCESKHTECRNSAQGSLPKRVVQILPGSKPGACKVRLFEPPSHTKGAYACLSHCWGKRQIIVSKKNNLVKHKQEIPWNELSTTFKDAIEFTLLLGIEFIWIDSLCIIQDHTEDWEEEAVKMAAYYANAQVTLAATAASDGSVGFFPKSLSRLQALELQGKDNQGRPYYLMARAMVQHAFQLQHEDLYDFPLLTRGWVHQEHILSRRFLNFGPQEIMWECHSSTRCQCGAIPTPRSDHATNQMLSVTKHGLNTQDAKARRRLWYENVESIMNLDFTYVKDRLPAAAGVATRLGKGHKGRYLAGLWEDCLIQDLCWVVTEFGSRPDELNFMPSWSWGSVSGDLATLWCQSDITDQNVQATAKVVEIDCKPSTPSYIGHLTRGILTLEGLVVEGKAAFGTQNSHKELIFSLEGERLHEHEGALKTWGFVPDVVSEWENQWGGREILLVEMMRKTVNGVIKAGVFLVLRRVHGKTDLWERGGLLRAQERLRGRSEPGVPFLKRFQSVARLGRVKVC